MLDRAMLSDMARYQKSKPSCGEVLSQKHPYLAADRVRSQMFCDVLFFYHLSGSGGPCVSLLFLYPSIHFSRLHLYI